MRESNDVRVGSVKLWHPWKDEKGQPKLLALWEKGPNVQQQENIPGIPNNIPRAQPPQNVQRPPQKKDEDDEDGGGSN